MKKSRWVIKYSIILLISLFVFIPSWDMLINSFKTAEDASPPSIKLPAKINLVENYAKVLSKAKIVRSFFNSVMVTGVSVFFILGVSSLAAYVFGRRKERWVRIILYIFLLGIITPPSMVLTVMMLKYLKLIGTYWGIILFYTATYCAIPIYIITGFMSTVPHEIEESAIMDGIKPQGIFFKIVLPLLKSAIATSMIYILIKVWNDFLYPIFVLAGNTRKYTMIINLYFFKGQFYTQWNLVFAFLIMVSLPVTVVFIFAQKHITTGLTAGALKG